MDDVEDVAQGTQAVVVVYTFALCRAVQVVDFVASQVDKVDRAFGGLARGCARGAHEKGDDEVAAA